MEPRSYLFRPKNLLTLLFILVILFSTVLSYHIFDFEGEKKEKDFEKPPIILITLESVRSHNIGPCYGYDRSTAPNICSLSEDGILFKNAYSQGTATTVAIPSLITGDLPISVAKNDIGDPLLDGAVSLPKILQQEGYYRQGYFDTVQGELIKSSLLNQMNEIEGWESYNRSSIPNRIIKHEKSFTWIFSRKNTHKPYTSTKENRKWADIDRSEYYNEGVINSKEELSNSSLNNQDLIDFYDEAILSEDERIGKFLEELKEKGIYRDSIIVVTGDHGESFGTYGRIGHGDEPVEQQIKVPLLIKLPNNEHAGKVIEKDVRHMDIVPTILDYTNLTRKEGIEGKSLRGMLQGEEMQLNIISSLLPIGHHSIRKEDYKLMILNPKNACIDWGVHQTELFKFGADGREDVSSEKRNLRDNMISSFCEVYSSGYLRRIGNLNSTN